MRTPLPSEALEIFKNCFQNQIDTVIDVGVQTKTDFLINAFPNAHHVLFEPVVIYHDMIRKNYDSQGIKYTLVESAVSDRSGVMFQHLLSSDLSGGVTHSQLLPEKDRASFGDSLIEIRETPVVSLNEYFSDSKLGSYIIKIDVDGIEDLIIDGGDQIIAGSVLLFTEAHLSALATRAVKLQNLGLKLFDIVGNGYYFDQLQQVDLVLVSEKIVNDNIEFQPWKKTGHVIWDKWQQFI